MRQQSLFGPSGQSDDVHAALRQIVDVIGLKEAAFVCNAQPSALSDALRGEGQKYVRVAWLIALMTKAPPALGLELRRLICGQGYGVVEIAPLKPEEELRLLRDRVRNEFGAAGERLIAEVRR